jgi:hypothetical protein
MLITLQTMSWMCGRANPGDGVRLDRERKAQIVILFV